MKLSPINQRRWCIFRQHKRAYWSTWILAIILCFCVSAEWIANDKPILIIYQGEWLFPILHFYPETHFGGEFATEAEYLDPYVQELLAQATVIWPPLVSYYDTIHYDLPQAAPSPPDSKHWLGTDDQGRDVLTRVVYGTRISLAFALLLTLITSSIGILIGALQGYYAGWVDLIGQRVLEIWSGLPTLFILIILASVIQPGFWWLLAIMSLFSWPTLVDLVRAETLRCRNLDYVRAARALGVSNFSIIRRHILPNAMVASLTFMPFIFTGAVTTLTALDFLGFGLPVGEPSLGELLAQGKNNLQAPWLGLSAFATLAILLSLLVFIGEGLRDAFDPRAVFAS
uniref:ABC transporter permease n=1 Tax=Allopseudospirillum japonicum TaxID=64971 RepID=UPI000B89F652|nr:ABC transporter permease [Allopseudospirillum japonicum]